MIIKGFSSMKCHATIENLYITGLKRHRQLKLITQREFGDVVDCFLAERIQAFN